MLLCLSPALFSLSSVLNFEVLLLICRRTGLVIEVTMTLILLGLGRLLDHGCLAKPLLLVKDRGSCCHSPVHDSGSGVKGLATEVDVQQGRVREDDRLGNAEADAAAELGSRHQSELVMDVRRALLNARNHWYLIVQQLHRFMVAVSRVAVNHDGFRPDPFVWDQGSKRKQRKTDIRVNVDLASLPGPPVFLNGPGVQVDGGCITDVAACPHFGISFGHGPC